jgi:hypothetical protein
MNIGVEKRSERELSTINIVRKKREQRPFKERIRPLLKVTNEFVERKKSKPKNKINYK